MLARAWHLVCATLLTGRERRIEFAKHEGPLPASRSPAEKITARIVLATAAVIVAILAAMGGFITSLGIQIVVYAFMSDWVLRRSQWITPKRVAVIAFALIVIYAFAPQREIVLGATVPPALLFFYVATAFNTIVYWFPPRVRTHIKLWLV